MLLWFLFKQEILQWIVAIIVNLAVFYKRKDNYWIFNFTPSILGAFLPDAPYAFSLFLEIVFDINLHSNFLHRLFDTILVSWLFIPLILGLVYVLSKVFDVKRKKDWVTYVILVSLIAMVIHIYIMDPLGF
ncbi:MAG: hypothetical protein ACLFPQ_01575 [Candidatus Woesearchaeota archaeon]